MDQPDRTLYTVHLLCQPEDYEWLKALARMRKVTKAGELGRILSRARLRARAAGPRTSMASTDTA
jgi:hypothetical protein